MNFRRNLKAIVQYIGLFDFFRDLEIQLRSRFGGVHDPEYRRLPKSLDGQLLIDIGANIGQSIISLKSLFPLSKIVAYEPNPRCASILQKVVDSKNGAVLHKVGLGAASGEFDFFVPVLPDGTELLQEGSYDISVFREDVTIERIQSTFKLKCIVVPIRTLDSYFLSPGLIKIDVQGLELQVLEGAISTIDRSRPIIFLERDIRSESQINQFLTSRGYLAHVIGCNCVYCPDTKAA